MRPTKTQISLRASVRQSDQSIVRIKNNGVLGYPTCAQYRFWSECANAQADLNFRNPASILYKSTAGRFRPVSYPDGPMTARCRFVKNAYWEGAQVWRYIVWRCGSEGTLSVVAVQKALCLTLRLRRHFVWHCGSEGTLSDVAAQKALCLSLRLIHSFVENRTTYMRVVTWNTMWAGPKHFLQYCESAQADLNFRSASVDRKNPKHRQAGSEDVADLESWLGAHAVLWKMLCPGSLYTVFILK